VGQAILSPAVPQLCGAGDLVACRSSTLWGRRSCRLPCRSFVARAARPVPMGLRPTKVDENPKGEDCANKGRTNGGVFDPAEPRFISAFLPVPFVGQPILAAAGFQPAAPVAQTLVCVLDAVTPAATRPTAAGLLSPDRSPRASSNRTAWSGAFPPHTRPSAGSACNSDCRSWRTAPTPTPSGRP
jgi:hypothetical protein